MLQTQWKHFLVDIKKSEKDVERETSQTNLNRKIREGTIKYNDLSKIVEKYGYSIKIHKDT